MRRAARVWVVGLAGVVVFGVMCAGAQTPASQANENPWKQTPEGRPAVQPAPMNCSGTTTRGDDGKITTTSNCAGSQDQPVPSNAAQQFPYPGETSAPNANTPNDSGAQNGTRTPASPAQQFPYPGDASGASSAAQPAATKPSSGGLKDAGSSGSSSSDSSSSSSSSSNADDGLGGASPDTTPAVRRRRRQPAMPRQTPTQRETEDLKVAGFYQNDGNFMGAYLRAKDAVTVADDDAEAHLALGDAARKLGKLDEAEQNYRKCLTLDPVPRTRRRAEDALKEMTGGA